MKRPFYFTLRNEYVPLNDKWKHVPIQQRHDTLLGASFQPLRAMAYDLDPDETLDKILELPLQVIRLGAYWNRIEKRKGIYDTEELDRWFEKIEQSGKKIIFDLGPIKTFSYPEFHTPQRYIPTDLRDGHVFSHAHDRSLLTAANKLLAFLVDRYKDRRTIMAWQLENEANDAVPFAHNWRLAKTVLMQELAVLEQHDSKTYLMMNGYLLNAPLVRLGQIWINRGRQDSISFSKQYADIVGVDYYPKIFFTQDREKELIFALVQQPRRTHDDTEHHALGAATRSQH